jgi:predicted nucleic acid-binding protein
MAMMGVRVFVDTNVLLRALHADFPEHPRARTFIEQQLDNSAVLTKGMWSGFSS